MSQKNHTEMAPEDESFLQGIRARFAHQVSDKFRQGQREHGGHLWEKPGMLGHLREEILDLVVYEHTLRLQLNQVIHEMRELGEPTLKGYAARLDAIVNGSTKG